MKLTDKEHNVHTLKFLAEWATWCLLLATWFNSQTNIESHEVESFKKKKKL